MPTVADVVEPPPLVVTVTELARRLGITEDDTTRPVLEDAIRDTQDEVEAYLGRVITPARYTEEGLFPWPDGWDLEHYPVVEVETAVAETDPETGQPNGLFTVTYTAGIDARGNRELRPILHYVRQHAMNAPAAAKLWREQQPDGGRRAKSVSAEGQSISWDYLTPSGGTEGGNKKEQGGGGLPTLKSLDRWRVAGRRVFQRRTLPRQPWPYSGDREWRRWWP